MTIQHNRQPAEPDCSASAERIAHYLRPLKLPVALGLAILFAVATNIRDYRHTANRERIEGEGVTVRGVLIKGAHSVGRRGRSDFWVRYITTDQQVIEQQFQVTGRFFLGRTDDQFITDSQVDVRYLPGDPRNAFVIDGTLKMPYWVLALLDVFLAVVIGGAFYYFATLIVNCWTRQPKVQDPPPPAEP